MCNSHENFNEIYSKLQTKEQKIEFFIENVEDNIVDIPEDDRYCYEFFIKQFLKCKENYELIINYADELAKTCYWDDFFKKLNKFLLDEDMKKDKFKYVILDSKDDRNINYIVEKLCKFADNNKQKEIFKSCIEEPEKKEIIVTYINDFINSNMDSINEKIFFLEFVDELEENLIDKLEEDRFSEQFIKSIEGSDSLCNKEIDDNTVETVKHYLNIINDEMSSFLNTDLNIKFKEDDNEKIKNSILDYEVNVNQIISYNEIDEDDELKLYTISSDIRYLHNNVINNIKDNLRNYFFNIHELIELPKKIISSLILNCYSSEECCFKRTISFDEISLGELYGLDAFIRKLQNLLDIKYESNKLNLDLIYSKYNTTIPEELKENLELVQLQECDIEEFIKSNKPLWKLFQSGCYTLVINKNFKVAGLIRKSNKGEHANQSIKNLIREKEELIISKEIISSVKNYIEINRKNNKDNDKFKVSKEKYNRIIKNLEEYVVIVKAKIDTIDSKFNKINKRIELLQNKYNETRDSKERKDLGRLIKNNKLDYNSVYINMEDNKIEFYIQDGFFIVNKNGKWKLNNYSELAIEIFSHTVPFKFIVNKIYEAKNDGEINAYVDKSIEKISKLVDIIKSISKSEDGGLILILSPNSKEYKSIMINESKDMDAFSYDNICMINENIIDIDKNMLQHIIAVDGGTVFDSDLNLLSFKETVKIKELDDYKHETVYGTKSKAALSAASHGALSIKISEDGDIVVYKLNKDSIDKVIHIS